ncbi:MAG: hypothetical protein IJD51_01220 [Clostridia bacterium]|nr:hypothetical protein [Clostridia bacterium]
MNFIEMSELCTSLAMSVLLLACIRAFYVALKNRTLIGELSTTRRVAIGPYYWFLIGFFVSTVLLFYPIYFHYEIGIDGLTDTSFTHGLKTVLMSVHNTIRLFVVDGDYEIVKTAVARTIEQFPEFDGFFSRFYSTYVATAFVVAPVITAGFLLSLFKETVVYWRYMCTFNANYYYLSELNERSITLAEDIIFPRSYLKEKKALGLLSPLCRGISTTVKSSCRLIQYLFWCIFNKERKKKSLQALFHSRRNVVIFADVYSNDDEQTAELIARAKRLGAICLRKCITEISLKHFKARQRKLYFIGADEDENTRQALTMITRCVSDPKQRYNTPNTEMYLFADTVEGGILLDTVDNGEIKVRSVRRTRNLVTSTFFRPVEIYERKRVAYEKLLSDGGFWRTGESTKSRQRSEELMEKLLPLPKTLYDDYATVDGVKHLNVVLVGLGGYGTEFLKTFCWCSQLPDYFVNIYAFDSDPNAVEKLQTVAPELMLYNGEEQKRGLNPLYSINIYPGTDAESDDLARKIAGIENITHIFVALGNDELNISAAIRINTALKRKSLVSGEAVPTINTIVYSAVKNFALLTGKDKEEGHHNTKEKRKELARAAREEKQRARKQLAEILDCRVNDRRLGSLLKKKARIDAEFDELPECRLKASKDHQYSIRFFGSMKQRYSLEFIERRHVEILGEAVNNNWSGVVDRIDKLRSGYDETAHNYTSLFNHYEYNRHSSIASAVHGGIWWYMAKRLGLGEETILSEAGEYEHIRWAAFMRAEGFVVSPEDPKDKTREIPKDFVAKTHPCLRYDYKPNRTQEDVEKDEAAIRANKRT